MGFLAASSDILSQAYSEPPGPLGKEFRFEGGIFMWVLARATLGAGDLCAWKIGVNPNLFEVDDQTGTTVEVNRPAGFACAAATTGQYIAIQIGGCNTSLALGLTTDGGVVQGEMCIPHATDKQLESGVTGTNEGLAIVRALDADDASSDLLQYRIMNLR